MLNVTSAEAGFPGSAKTGFEIPPAQGMVANVVGLPGLTVTRPKWIVPEKWRSITGLRRSVGPMDVPPVVSRMSAVSRPFRIASTCEVMLAPS